MSSGGDQSVSHKAILLPGIVLPAQLAYPALLEALGEGVDARAKELEVYADFGPLGRTEMKGRVEKQRQAAALERREAVFELLADPRRGRLRQLAESGLLAQRLDVAHRQAAHERADHQRLQRLGPQQLRSPGRQLAGKRLRRLADLLDLHRQLAFRGLDPARAKAVAQPALVVTQPALVLRPALVTSPAQPGVELVLNGPLDDQPGAELRQRLARVLADPHGQQLVDPRFDLRRRRHRTSHGVGLLHRLVRI
jgi:hypothetical protein